MHASQHHWLPRVAKPSFLTIVEECEELSSSLDTCEPSPETGANNENNSSDNSQLWEDFDGVDDILAVSHVTDKPIAKKKPPLLRAKTLPAIISPSLSILQAQLDSNHTTTRVNTSPANSTESLKSKSSSSQKSKRSSGEKKGSIAGTQHDGLKWHFLVVEEEHDCSEAGGGAGSCSSRSPGVSPRHSVSSTSSTSSQQEGKTSKDRSSKYESGSGSRASLAKLARMLIAKDKSPSGERVPQATASAAEATSAQSDIMAAMRRSASIDSLLGSVSAPFGDRSTECGLLGPLVAAPLTSSSAPASSGKPSPPKGRSATTDGVPKRGLPSSPSVPNKLGKGVGPVIRQQGSQGNIEVPIETLALTKADKKKLDKWNKFNFDLQALFVAVEQDILERAQHILDSSSDIDVNSVNSDGFAPLDIAVMTANVPMVKLLQSYGARETTRFPNKESRSSQLSSLMKEAERCVQDLSSCVKNATTNGTLSAALLKEKEKKLTIWERREQLFKKMKIGFEAIRPPDPPRSIQLEVVGTRSLKVKIQESDTAHEAQTITTKYKVQWNSEDNWQSPQDGSLEVSDIKKLEITIPDLTQGKNYFVRVAAGNMKGYSKYQISIPPSAIPSSWCDVNSQQIRSLGRLGKLDDLFHQIINSRPEHAAEVKAITEYMETPQQQRRLVRKSIKNLFTPAPKFQKSMKRGVFLSCLLYNEDRVLVTTEETLPIIEIDETYPSSLHTDFHWLMKVACTWEDVKTLRQDMDRSHSASNVHFRSRLLQAVEQMQNALGIQDIGHLFYKPLKDSEGTLVLCTIKYIADPKSIGSLSIRWLPLTKIQKRLSTGETTTNGVSVENPSASELLLSSLQEMITYNQVSHIPLSRGLYLGYVKLRSSVDLIRVLVPLKTPNVLPHWKIRENPHVSCEEWKWLNELNSEDKSTPNEIQLKFQRAISSAARNLLTHLDIPEDQADIHRLYDVEVVELSSDVSFILLLPAIESVCAVPGQSDELTSRMDFIPLPVQIFEMIHMGTYQPTFIARYSRLSSILETDTMVAQHAHREAFSTVELSSARSRLSQLQQFQAQVDDTWRGMRWIMDALTFARDKQTLGGICLSSIFLRALGGALTPEISPNQSPLQTLHVPHLQERRLSREEIDRNFLWITTLQGTNETNKSGSPIEIRRCASTSRLIQPANNRSDNEENDQPSTSMGDCMKAISADTLNAAAENEDNDSDKLEIDEGLMITVPVLGEPKVYLSDSMQNFPQTAEAEEVSEEASVYSKDSACSMGGDEAKEELSAEEKAEESLDLLRRTSSTSSLSIGSQPSDSASDIIRVYAGYVSGLPTGTSVRLQISSKTTSREIIDLVVKQLNMAVILKGREGPIYSSNQLDRFCLVSRVGSRENCFSDDYQVFNLEEPWNKGKLIVCMKSDLKSTGIEN